MLAAYPHRSTQPESVEHVVRGVGGSAAVTKQLGAGLALTRTGTGAYRITWSETPGTFLGAVASLMAATPGDLAGHTVIFDTYDATNRRLDFIVYNASDAAHDLAANEYVVVVAKFVTGAVGA
jgi:O-acetyl-ADP-ribose deacetylase (regulator of RNase III)